MRLTFFKHGAFVAAIVALSGFAVSAQKGKGKPTTQPATATFRCPGPSCPAPDPNADPPMLTDSIRADAGTTSGALPFTVTDGATIDTVMEFALRPSTNRFLTLDFSNGPAACAGCRRTFTTIDVGESHQTMFHTNVLDPATGEVASQGLYSIPVGATWRSRLKVAFATIDATGREIAWAVRFNTDGYAPSDHIYVRRLTSTSWQIYATAAERAMLVSFVDRRTGNLNEGLYVMPFSVVVTTP